MFDLAFLISFLRPVAMIIQIAKDIKFFLLIIAVVIVGFAQAFWLLSSVDTGQTYGTINTAFLNTFLTMLGQIDPDFSGTASPELGVILLICFVMFMAILMLNLLIALMGESFSKVSDEKIPRWRLEQASIILEQLFLKKPGVADAAPFIHLLRYASDVSDSDSAEQVTLEDLADFEQRMQGMLEEKMADVAELKVGMADLKVTLDLVLAKLNSGVVSPP